jgi:hypothetical protein
MRLIFTWEKVVFVLILTKNGLGYILGDLLTSSPGHPDDQYGTGAASSKRD